LCMLFSLCLISFEVWLLCLLILYVLS
jgi:hypothetical protein